MDINEAVKECDEAFEALKTKIASIEGVSMVDEGYIIVRNVTVKVPSLCPPEAKKVIETRASLHRTFQHAYVDIRFVSSNQDDLDDKKPNNQTGRRPGAPGNSRG